MPDFDMHLLEFATSLSGLDMFVHPENLACFALPLTLGFSLSIFSRCV